MIEQNLFDKHYFLTSCGIPYDQKDKWEDFFGRIADRIIRDINPGTVLDAGCAYGYLVAALRDRGVTAYGIDISNYAISQVREDIRPYCKVGSIVDPLPMRYDLVVCIEVLEHMTPDDGRKAIDNLCRFTDDFLFTSTPFDFKEATHFNVQNTDYWVSLFAQSTFFRDVDFDASFIISHAIRFRKGKRSVTDVAREYEKAYFRYYLESKTLREELVRARTEISSRFNENESTLLAEKNLIINGKDNHIANLEKSMQDREENIKRLAAAAAEQEAQIVTLNQTIGEKEELLQRTKEELLRVDIEHLRDLEQRMSSLREIIEEKDGELRRSKERDTARQIELNVRMEALNREKEEAIGRLEGHIRQIGENVRSVEELIRSKDTHELNFKEVVEINQELKKKIKGLYFIREEHEKAIQSIKNSSHELKADLDSRTVHYDALMLQYKAAHTELERIRQLKGYKLLWKYYLLRDRILGRKKGRRPGTIGNQDQVDISTMSDNQGQQGPSLLEKEIAHYSRNPIYGRTLSFNPLISIIVPVFNTPPGVLEEMIRSVTAQTYPHFELLIVNASVDNPELGRHVSHLASKDPRIRYSTTENKGIAGNSNVAIGMATGEFVAFLDHDDTLAPHALFEVVSRLQDDPMAYDFFYSDKDMMPENGKTSCNPLYKPQWSPEMMLSANYLTHFCVIRKRLIEESGMLDSRTDGAQDWDIFLRVSRLTSKIGHIPQRLYHWRIIQTSVASGIGAKPYALEAQLTCLRAHFEALNYPATIKFNDRANSILKVDWHGTENKVVTFIIQHTGTSDQLLSLLENIDQFHRGYGNAIELIILSKTSLPGVVSQSSYHPVLFLREADNVYVDINKAIEKAGGDIFLFLNSEVAIADNQTIFELISWAAQDQYGIIVPKIVDNKDVIVSAGIVINNNCILNMFQHVHSGHYTIFGHTEWYRNVTAGRLECFAVRSSHFRIAGAFEPEFEECACIEFCLRLLKTGHRHVYNPFATVTVAKLPDIDAIADRHRLLQLQQIYSLPACDPYWNPNLMANHTIPMENQRKVTPASPRALSGPVVTGWEKYSSDAFYLAHEFDFSKTEFENNLKNIGKEGGQIEIKSVNWILPHFDFIYYAGLYTIFRLANYLQSVEGVRNTIITVGGGDERDLYNIIVEAFPLMKGCKVLCLANTSDIKKIPYADASICSLWTTAYYLLRFNNTKRKFYFIQDYEPLFYPAGSTYGQTETTYTFSFYGIANTRGLRELYEEQYGGTAIDLKPCIDGSIFYPSRAPAGKDIFRVFFYGRPGHPRNGFELGATALKILKSRWKEKVEIYCAGSDWDPAEYGLAGIVTNMGRMDMEKTGDLYRICHAGLVMMFTKHPSYLPFELMACGCAVVSNYNKDTTWFLKDHENCLLSEASATRISETLEKVLTDDALRSRLTSNALRNIKEGHAEWDAELGKIYRFMCSPSTAVARDQPEFSR
ncbi:MAG: glycosyltransferase [Bacteroidota bacterium]|nr:glycosyltransferase [Bacteroidota bacterium]